MRPLLPNAPAATTWPRCRQDWNFYLAYNLFRIAAILQGIAKRVEEGTAASDEARLQGAAARPLAEIGWGFARRAGAPD